MADQKEPHPMVAVPDAIRTVLRESAVALLENPPSPLVLSASSSWKELLGQTLARDVLMVEPGYPGYNASIMDGYVIRTAVCVVPSEGKEQEWTHHVVDKVYAGDDSREKKTVNESSSHGLPLALYITTGAPIPNGFNCVVPIEQCRVSADQKFIAISKEAEILDGKWIRGVGCDMAASSTVLPRGHVLDPVAVGLLLQSGAKQVEIQPQIKVGVLSTGNELLLPDEEGGGVGRIPDVNRPILLSLLSTFGSAVPVDMGIERDDDIDSLTQTVRKALEDCDVIITTGGISMGETDVVEDVLVDRLGGKLHFGRMHMKPGKPTTFVTISHGSKTKLVFAMPGNPVSATVCTQLLVRPCLDLLYNGPADTHGESTEERIDRVVQNAWVHPEVPAVLTNSVQLDKERPEYRRVTLAVGKDGRLHATATGVQRSSRLQSLRDAEGLLLLPQGVSNGKSVANAGETYTVLLLNSDPKKRVRVCDSAHLRIKSEKELRVGLIRVVADADKAEPKGDLGVTDALSGSKSGKAIVVSSTVFSGKPEDLFDVVQSLESVDLYVVSCASFEGSFQYYLDVSSCLRQRLEKVADTMALQARRGAASQDPVSGLFEVVVGYVARDKGAMLICLPESGLAGGLQNVGGVLKHALQVGRGNRKSHSHGPQHDHSHSHGYNNEKG